MGSRLGALMFAGLRAEGGRIDVKNFSALQRPTSNAQRPTPKGRIPTERPSFSKTLVLPGWPSFLGRWALGVGRWALKCLLGVLDFAFLNVPNSVGCL